MEKPVVKRYRSPIENIETLNQEPQNKIIRIVSNDIEIYELLRNDNQECNTFSRSI